MKHLLTHRYALELDAQDPLSKFRQQFHLPKQANGEPVIYLCGNSLGLQPKLAREYVNRELDKWAELGVEGHFHEPDAWYSYHELLSAPMAEVVGAKPHEVVVMNTLTTNLHLLMVSFYRPTAERYKILVEKSAFPSDQYAVASQAAFHGFDPGDAIVEMSPREGEATIRLEDIQDYLKTHGSEVALILFGGVHYYSGQFFDLEAITKAGHEAGCIVGFDLAHAAGNVQLKLHDWDVDFAAWCSYKYLNSGPGGIAGCFVHERYKEAFELPRFAGWWGTDPKSRFEMLSKFSPQPGAAGWQLSNAMILPMASLRASLALFSEATMPALRHKSEQMTAYLLDLIDHIPQSRIEVITPRAPEARGCQISLRVREDAAENLFAKLESQGVICDYRRPDVIRIAPVPLYNSFSDIWYFCDILSRTLLDSE